jgi:hypothetical protein
MTRSDGGRDRPGSPDGRARLLVAGASRPDELMDLVMAEVGRLLPVELLALLVGTTSLAPRDEAARAARWVSRLAAAAA